MTTIAMASINENPRVSFFSFCLRKKIPGKNDKIVSGFSNPENNRLSIFASQTLHPLYRGTTNNIVEIIWLSSGKCGFLEGISGFFKNESSLKPTRDASFEEKIKAIRLSP